MSLPVVRLAVVVAVVLAPVVMARATAPPRVLGTRSVTAAGVPDRHASPGVAMVDTARSVVRWRGTKFGGRGAHAGLVRV
nr:hypothetical protein [Gemmatimonadaceae bacterium]